MTGIIVVAALAICIVCGLVIFEKKDDEKDDQVDSKEVALEMAPSSSA